MGSSQLYSPINGGSLIRLDSLLESFTSKINGFQNLSYWERLEKLKIYSLTRRFERYKLIYCMKVLNNETQNCGLSWNYTPEFGILFNVPKFGEYYSKERNLSFKYMGPALSNSLPLYLRKEI